MIFSNKIRLLKTYPVIVLGFTSVITQIVSMREFQSVLYGNELVYGLIFTVWMTLTALGVIFGKYLSDNKKIISLITAFQFIIAFLPFLTIYFLRYLRFTLFDFGVALNIIEILYYSIIILSPFCIISGILFTLFSSHLATEGFKLSKSYYYETLGSIIGGIIISLLLLFVFNRFHILILLFILNLSSIISFSQSERAVETIHKKNPVIVLSIILIISSCVLFTFNFDFQSKKYLFNKQKIIESKDTPYGNIVVTKTSEQYNFFLDGIILFSTGNFVDAEESVHYAMSQTDTHKNILLISGGICGLTNEILKYNCSEIDYMEIDPELIRLGIKYTNSDFADKVNVINEDARLYIKKTKKSYDCVIMFLPEPSTAQLNRFYTLEFFRELKSKMTKSSVLTLSLPLTENYVSKEAADLNSSVYLTLKSIFKNVIIIPGGKNYYIVSDKALSYDIGNLIDSRGIENKYVNKYYYDESSTKQRADNIIKSLNSEAKINRDFKPIAYYLHILYLLSYSKINLYLLLTILILPFLIILSRLKPLGIGLFTGGFTAIGAELIILFSFQFIFGNVYYMLSTIITVFMAGIAFGVNSFKKFDNLRKFIASQLLMTIYITVLPVFILFIKQISEYYFASVVIFMILTFIGASFIGIQYSSATGNIRTDLILRKKITHSSSAIVSMAYSADLFGSALGALLISSFLLPWIGIINLGIMLGSMNLMSAIIIIISTKNKQ
ncbi:MAG: hypothetical protein HZB41_08480 [Ignavibacteriae bacterium]|nr:hypothetical protein [Ignavibacteriota bacterium]